MSDIKYIIMKPIIDEIYQIIQNKKKPTAFDTTTSLEHLEASLLNKICSQILSNYCFKNLPESLPCINTNLRSVYYLLRDVLIYGSIFLIGFIIYLVSFTHSGLITQFLFVIMYGILAGTTLTSFHVLVHECIHETFLTNKNMNHIVGFLISTSLGIPYHSVCYSHAKHHRYVNHLFYGENMIPYNISEDSRDQKDNSDVFTYIRKIIMNMKLWLYQCNRGIFSLINIITTLIFGVDMYLLFNIGGGRIDYRTKKKIKPNLPRDHYRSNSIIFLESQENFVRISTFGIIAVWLLVIYTFTSHPVTTFCFYLFPRIVANAWIVMYSWIAHTNMNIPYHGPKSFNKFKSNVSVISSSYGQFLDHLHHNIGLNATIHHLCPSIPHYLCRSLIPTIKNNVLSDAKLMNLYNKLDDVYPTYRKLITCIKSCTKIIKELEIVIDSKSDRPLSQVLKDLEKMTDKDYFREKCMNKTELSFVKNLRLTFQSIKKYENKINNIFCEYELTLSMTNLLEIVRASRCDDPGDKNDDNVLKKIKNIDDFTVDQSQTKQNTMTLKKFVDMYRYKENTNTILEKLIQNSIMCQFIEGPMDETVYYKGFNHTH